MHKELLDRNLSRSGYQNIGQFNKTNDSVRSRRKVISFSDPFPSNKIHNTINNVDFLKGYPGNIRRTKHTVAKSNNDNDDIVKYLQQFDDIDNGHSYSLPILKRNLTPILTSDCESYCAHPFSEESYYQNCSTSREADQEQEIPSPSYFNETLENECNHYANVTTSYQQRLSQQGSPPLQPSKRHFIDGTNCLPESNRKNNIRGISIETSSALSSETDSDFTFYSSYRQFQDSFGLESTSLSNTISQLPSQLEDPDSPCPPFRKGFLENSLEDFSRQFYLEDDVLSDDVFVEDYPNLKIDDTDAYKLSRFQCHPEYRNTPFDKIYDIDSQLKNMTIVDTPKRSSSTFTRDVNNFIVNESPYRNVVLEACEERSLTLVFKEAEVKEMDTKASVKSNEAITVDFQISDTAPSNVLQERKRISESEFEDYDLSEYNLNLANAFDSLRRNSMQTKSRKLWRERRTKMRRSTLFNVKTTTVFPDGQNVNEFVNDNEKYRKNSGSLPCEYRSKSSQDLISKNLNNKKPLRGILKNKNSINPVSCSNKHSGRNIQRGDGLYEYNDNDISSDNFGNCVYTVMKEDNNQSSSFNEQPMMTCCNCANCHGGYTLDSGPNSHWKQQQLSPRILSCSPSERRQSRLGNKCSPTYVSVGVQVNLLD